MTSCPVIEETMVNDACVRVEELPYEQLPSEEAISASDGELLCDQSASVDSSSVNERERTVFVSSNLMIPLG